MNYEKWYEDKQRKLMSSSFIGYLEIKELLDMVRIQHDALEEIKSGNIPLKDVQAFAKKVLGVTPWDFR